MRRRRQTIEGRLDGEQRAGRCDSSAFTIPVKVSAARQPDDLMASAALVEVTCCIFFRWLCSSTSPAHLHPAAPPPLLWSFNSFLSHPSIHPSKRWEALSRAPACFTDLSIQPRVRTMLCSGFFFPIITTVMNAINSSCLEHAFTASRRMKSR